MWEPQLDWVGLGGWTDWFGLVWYGLWLPRCSIVLGLVPTSGTFFFFRLDFLCWLVWFPNNLYTAENWNPICDCQCNANAAPRLKRMNACQCKRHCHCHWDAIVAKLNKLLPVAANPWEQTLHIHAGYNTYMYSEYSTVYQYILGTRALRSGVHRAGMPVRTRVHSVRTRVPVTCTTRHVYTYRYSS